MSFRSAPYSSVFVLAAVFTVSLGTSMPALSAVAAEVSADPWKVIEVNTRESLAAYRDGRADEAYLLAATAYLDGFELLEDRLKEIDPDLMKTIEQGMGQMRDLIRQGASPQVVENQNRFVQGLLSQAHEALDAAGGTVE